MPGLSSVASSTTFLDPSVAAPSHCPAPRFHILKLTCNEPPRAQVCPQNGSHRRLLAQHVMSSLDPGEGGGGWEDMRGLDSLRVAGKWVRPQH